MEKSNGRCIFRSRIAEEQALKTYNDEKQKKMELLYSRMQDEYERKINEKGISN